MTILVVKYEKKFLLKHEKKRTNQMMRFFRFRVSVEKWNGSRRVF